MKKEISLEEPFMKSVTYLASFFSFVEVNRVTMPWLLKFFSSPFAYKKTLDNGIESKSHGIVSANYLNDYFMMCCPFVEVCNINQSLIGTSIFEFIKNAILNGFCMTAVINPHYIKAYGDFELNEHDLLIIGFDDENEILYGKDFFPPLRKFERQEIPFYEYVEAFDARNTKYNIRLFRKREVISEPTQDNLNKVLREALTNYLDQSMPINNPYYPLVNQVKKDEPSEFMEPGEVWTGIGVYDALILNIRNIYLRELVLFIDVHRLIYEALLYALPYNNIESFKNIIEELELMLSLAIKYKMTRQVRLLKSMVDRLQNLKEREREYIIMLLNQLKKI